MPQNYISQWKSADEHRRRAMTSGRNTWKQPEPPPKPKPKQYFILGMEVDYNTYREFMYNREYRIDGDILKDVVCWLPTLERYATEEHAKDYPIEAANARKILDQIREEIKTITGKDDNNMTNPRTAADFIGALNDIYTESRNAYDAIQGKVDAAKAKMDRAEDAMKDPECNNRQIAQLRYDVAKGEWQLAEGGCRNEYQAMIATHEAKVKALRKQFAEYLDDHYSATPDKLDIATMQLLGSGICTPDELLSLVERHKDSPTMVRIIGSYADKMIENRRNMGQSEINALQTVRSYAAAAKNGNREMAIFDSAVSSTNYGLGREYRHATRMHSHVSGWLDDFKRQITDLPLTPEADE